MSARESRGGDRPGAPRAPNQPAPPEGPEGRLAGPGLAAKATHQSPRGERRSSRAQHGYPLKSASHAPARAAKQSARKRPNPPAMPPEPARHRLPHHEFPPSQGGPEERANKRPDERPVPSRAFLVGLGSGLEDGKAAHGRTSQVNNDPALLRRGRGPPWGCAADATRPGPGRWGVHVRSARLFALGCDHPPLRLSPAPRRAGGGAIRLPRRPTSQAAPAPGSPGARGRGVCAPPLGAGTGDWRQQPFLSRRLVRGSVAAATSARAPGSGQPSHSV